MTENTNETLDNICKLLENLPGNEIKITSETNLVEELSLDSVKVLDLIMEIEDEFDISIPINLMADVHTVRDLVEVIEQLK